MGSHARAAAQPSTRAMRGHALRRELLLISGGVTLTLIAWGYLISVTLSIAQGDGASSMAGWMLMGLAAVGAAACLFVTLVLILRIAVLVRTVADPPVVARPKDGSPIDAAEPAASPLPRPGGRRTAGHRKQ